MTKYRVTITRMSDKNKGLQVSYAKKRLDLILEIAKEAVEQGDKVEIQSFEIESKDFCELVLESIQN